MNHPSLSQTVCTALQIALVDLLTSWGVYPDSVTGHSSGEIAAAYALGALSMNDAMSVAYYRGLVAGQLLDDSIEGAMMAVGMSIEEIQPYLDKITSNQLVVACINSPSSLTVSGDKLAVETLQTMLKDQPVFSRWLEVDVAYHSPHMNKVADEYRNLLNNVQVQKPEEVEEHRKVCSIPKFFSSVTGTLFSADELNGDYWVSNLLRQVRFSESLKTLCFETGAGHVGPARTKRVKAAQKASVDCLIEIGPHSALSGPIKQIIRADTKLSSADISYISLLTRNANSVTTAMGAAAALASLNYPVNFEAINRPHMASHRHKPNLLVDIPPYSWNHTRTYWAEPRLSKMYRNRLTSRYDLIGAPENMACPFEPRWRNYIRTSELPWLLDHRIQGSIIFPAAGYLTIAIEAARQIMEIKEDSCTYLLEAVNIKTALILNETSAIEIMVSLSKPSQDHGSLFDFHIYSISEANGWSEHCTGMVGRQKSFPCLKEGAGEAYGYATVPSGTDAHGISVIDIPSFYHKLQKSGLEYGPCFSNLIEARVTQDGTCFAKITVPDTKSVMPVSFQHDLLIHPCTLDSIFHTIFAALPPSMGVEEGPVIPVSIEELVVSPGANRLPGDLMSICTHVSPVQKRDVTASIDVMDCNDKNLEIVPSISIRGLRCARLDRPETASTTKETDVIYKISWKADPSFIASNNASFLLKNLECQEETSLQTKSEQQAVADFIRAALKEVSAKEAMKLDASHRRFWCYLEDVLERYENEQSASTTDLQILEPAPMGPLLYTIGHNLGNIIRNQIDYSTVIKNDTALDEFWDMFSVDASYQAAANYVALLGHKKPDISILEFGVGTGQISEIFLRRLVILQGPSRCGKYTFAHESASVLEQTSKRLEPWSDWIECKPLDVGKSFNQQGFENNSFDVIILPHGLCTGRCEQTALSKVYDLLSPSGCLITINTFDPKRNLSKIMLFGALHCLLADEFCLGQGGWTESQWREVLGDAHFTIIDAFAEKSSNKSHQFIVAKKRVVEFSTAKVSIICEENAGDAAKCLASQLKKASCEIIITDIQNIDPEGQICIVLDVSNSSLLADPNQEKLSKIKAMLMSGAGVLWVTKGGAIESGNPDNALIFGFARTARAESGGNTIVTIDLDDRNPHSDLQFAEVISSLLIARFLCANPDDDTEYAERNGIIFIPRLLQDLEANKAMNAIDDTENVSAHTFHQTDQPLRLFRKNDKTGFVSDTPMSELPRDHVGIKVHAFGLSGWDSSQNPHYSEADDTLGLECSGVVYKVGSEVRSIAVGDRVACLGFGTARSFYHDRLSAFQIIHEDMTLEIASAIPLAYTTAYYVANYLIYIAPEESVLIHNAGTPFGQAIVDACLLKQTRVFAVVDSAADKDMLISHYGIHAGSIFESGKVDIAKSLLQLTDGKKADAVFAFDTTEEREVRNCTAPFGRIVILRTDFHETRGSPCPHNVSMSIVNIFDRYKERKDLVAHLWSKVAGLFREQRFRGPASAQVYEIPYVHEAIATASTKQHAVVSTKPDDIVLV
jgi:NADPH:quinone reductase-like Zn-dependent oxidoreductase/malonyl CoA-acyl carrier protein transacylase/ubiquinone/menaquinone biosynthesis C-methylase UbiE